MNQVVDSARLSIVLPARDEAESLTQLLPQLRAICPAAEIIVVDDGSTDSTAALCREQGVVLVHHPYSKGNGAAVKSGARAASRPLMVLMDADGQHDPADITRLLQCYDGGYDMVVGARAPGTHASLLRRLGNAFFNWFSSWMVTQRVEDLTSGFRVVDTEKFRRFLYLMPNGFSYPTTVTMAFFRVGYSVGYLAVNARRALGVSHVKPFADGFKFIMIIFRVGSLYSPLKLFLPISAAFFALGLGYYLYTYLVSGRLTNMVVLLFTTSVLVFLIGLVSEQVSVLYYRGRDDG